MKRKFRLRPIARCIADCGGFAFLAQAVQSNRHATGTARARTRTTTPARRNLLPLGATLAGMALAPACALAQTATPDKAALPGILAQAAGAREETTLPTVNVKSDREREDKSYQPGITNTTKLPLLPRDIPASITTVPEQLIYDRNADTMREALRNVPSLTFNAGEGGRIGDNITLRGYSVVGDLYLDGIRDIAQYNREVFNLEQIDVLRGSASMLFGRGSTGGIINQVSKQPFLVDSYDATLTVGSHDYRRATADLNKMIGENAAMRVNIMKTDAESFRDGVELDRWGFAPSIRWGIGTRNEFSLAYYRLGYDDVPDYGVPFFQGQPLNVPVNRFYGLASDYQRDDTSIATATYIHRFGPDTELKTVLRKADYKRDLWAVAPRLARGTSVITDATVINRQAQRRAGEEDTLTSQTDLTTKFSTGTIKHVMLAGAELLREEAYRWSWTGGGANPATTAGNPNPYAVLPANFFNATRTNEVRYQADTIGLYAQDIMALTPAWKLLLGARYDNFSADYDRAAPQGNLSRTDRVWSWRTGLMYQPTDTQSYYVAYGTSFNPSGDLYSLDDRSANTPPEKNRNIEAGAKWELFDGNLSLRTAVFRTEKTNERNTDLSMPDIFLLSGKRHTDGIEIEAAGRVTRNWEVFSGVALMDSKIDAASGQQANTQGKTPINTPDYTASLWTTYRLGGGWKVGGGLEAVGRRYANATNTNSVPHYTRWDALVAYEQKRYEIKLNVLNLLDEDYYEGVYQGHVIPGTKRALQVTARLKF